MTDIVTRRELNRATLERQLLLRRAPMSTVEATAQLVGLQAQVPQNPYLGAVVAPRRVRPGRARAAARRPAGRTDRGHAGHAPSRHRRRRRRAPAARPARPRRRSWPDTPSSPRARGRRPRPRARLRPRVARRAPHQPPGPCRDGRALPRARCRCPDLRVPVQAAPRPGAAARGVGADRTGHLQHPRVLARPPARREPVDRRARAAVPRRVRAGHDRRRHDVVAADGPARGARPARPPAPAAA